MIKKNTQNNVDEPGPQLVVEPPPQGQFPLSDAVHWDCSICSLALHTQHHIYNKSFIRAVGTYKGRAS